MGKAPIDSKATITLNMQRGSKDFVKTVHVTTVVQIYESYEI